jgi:hypothetical protein
MGETWQARQIRKIALPCVADSVRAIAGEKVWKRDAGIAERYTGERVPPMS